MLFAAYGVTYLLSAVGLCHTVTEMRSALLRISDLHRFRWRNRQLRTYITYIYIDLYIIVCIYIYIILNISL